MTRLLFALAILASSASLTFAQSVSLTPASDSLINSGKWEVRSKVEKLPKGVDEAFLLVNSQDACLVAFIDEGHGDYVAFSAGKAGKAVTIIRKDGKVLYLNRDGSGDEIRKDDPAFTYCASQIMAAPEFTPQFRSRFHGFADIK